MRYSIKRNIQFYYLSKDINVWTGKENEILYSSLILARYRLKKVKIHNSACNLHIENKLGV